MELRAGLGPVRGQPARDRVAQGVNGRMAMATIGCRVWLRLMGMLLALTVATVACAPSPSARPAASAPTVGSGEAASALPGTTADPAAEWDQVVAAARREGKISIMSTAGTDLRDGLITGFSRRYPEIQVEFAGAPGGALAAKLLTEREAGLHSVDLFIHGTTTIITTLIPAGAVDPITPFLVGPDVRDPSPWLGGRFDFADDAGQYNLVFTSGVKVPLVYNPQLVEGGEFRSYLDLLDPRWHGKLSMHDPRVAGPGLATASFLYAAPGLGEDYLRRLFATRVVFSKDDRQIMDWVARGQYPISLAPSETIASELIRRGLPLELIPAEALQESSYLTAAAGTVAVVNRAPHPNATKVYLNWLLGKEGQTDASRAIGHPSRRRDVPTDHLVKFLVPKEGAAYQENYKEPYVRLKDRLDDFLKAVVRD
jgi:iron(III) transport system substrate-binding protein